MFTFRCGSRHQGVRTRYFDRLIGVRVPEIKYGDIVMMDGAFEARRELKKPADEKKAIEVITEDDVENDELFMTEEGFEVQEGDLIPWNQFWATKEAQYWQRYSYVFSRSCASWKRSNRSARKQWARHKKMQHSHSAIADEVLTDFLKFQAAAEARDAYIEFRNAVLEAHIGLYQVDDDPVMAEDVEFLADSQTKLSWVYRHAA